MLIGVRANLTTGSIFPNKAASAYSPPFIRPQPNVKSCHAFNCDRMRRLLGGWPTVRGAGSIIRV
jgi:hypothetical protein